MEAHAFYQKSVHVLQDGLELIVKLVRCNGALQNLLVLSVYTLKMSTSAMEIMNVTTIAQIQKVLFNAHVILVMSCSLITGLVKVYNIVTHSCNHCNLDHACLDVN